MNKKHFLLAWGILVLFCSVCLWGFYFGSKKRTSSPPHLALKQTYFEPIKIQGFRSGVPSIEIEICGQTSRVDVDLGLGNVLSLPLEAIQRATNTPPTGATPLYGIRGKKYKCDLYEIPEVRIGRLTLNHVEVLANNIAWETDATLWDPQEHPVPHETGRVGWKLFSKLNLLLDCPKSIIAFCDGWDTLSKQGYTIEDFVEVPFRLDKGLIEFETTTANGPLLCVMDTGCSLNLLNKNKKEESVLFKTPFLQRFLPFFFNFNHTHQFLFDPNASYETPTFLIGGEEFGSLSFQYVHVPYPIDAFLGMEFLQSRACFIDFLHSKLYIQKTNTLKARNK